MRKATATSAFPVFRDVHDRLVEPHTSGVDTSGHVGSHSTRSRLELSTVAGWRVTATRRSGF